MSFLYLRKMLTIRCKICIVIRKKASDSDYFNKSTRPVPYRIHFVNGHIPQDESYKTQSLFIQQPVSQDDNFLDIMLIGGDATATSVATVAAVETSFTSITINSSSDRTYLSRGTPCIRYYSDVIMDVIASQITSFTIVYSTVCSDTDQRKHQSFA